MEQTGWKESPDADLIEQLQIIRPRDAQNRLLKELHKVHRVTERLGKIPKIEMLIELENDNPIISKRYPIPEKINQQVHAEIQRLLTTGIVRKAREFRYGSPAFPILKKNGDIRLVVDYRPLNKITITEAYPFPNIQDELRSIPKSSWFSQLDLRNGYHQIGIARVIFKKPVSSYQCAILNIHAYRSI